MSPKLWQLSSLAQSHLRARKILYMYLTIGVQKAVFVINQNYSGFKVIKTLKKQGKAISPKIKQLKGSEKNHLKARQKMYKKNKAHQILCYQPFRS